MAKVEHGKISIFYSYAHEDEELCEEIIRALKPLRDDGTVSGWHDRRIAAGENWRNQISDNLESAKIVLLMLSPDFMASEYCVDVELRRAMERHRQEQCSVVPVLLRDCDWRGTSLGNLQALPTDAKPVTEWEETDEALASVLEGVRGACRGIVDWENPYRRCSIGDWIEGEQTALDKQTGYRDVITLELRVQAKSRKKKRATIMFTVSRDGQIIPLSEWQQTGFVGGVLELGTDRFNIPLDEPLEDDSGSLMRQLRVDLPRNAELEKHETGRGEQKVSVGGKQYYCTWTSYEIRVAEGMDQVVATGKTWRCIDVPMDGIVKWEIDTPAVSGKYVLVDYGFGGQ